jgi:hypothetical protein
VVTTTAINAKGGDSKMLTFLSIITHAAADCLAHNEKVRKVTFEAASQMELLAKKHGIKIVGGWTVHSKHFQVFVYEAPSFEAMQAWSSEPAIANMMGFYNSDIWVAVPLAEQMQQWMQMMQAK